MSAYLCSEELISGIVNSVGGTEKDFRMLVKENLRSLEARYPGRDFLEDWKIEARTMALDPEIKHSLSQVIKSCDCYDYQACETSDYDDSKACDYIAKVRETAIASGGKQEGPEYAAAQWGL